MAAKQVQIEASMGAGYRIECKAGGHTILIDQPAPAGGTDAGPTPLQYQMVCLAGCICSIARIVASQKRIVLRGMSVKVDGTIDTAGLLGKGGGARVGFSAIKAIVSIDADMSQEEKAGFLHEVDLRCPISENLLHETPVSVELG